MSRDRILCISVDGALNGGIQNFCKILVNHYQIENYWIFSKTTSLVPCNKTFKVVGTPPIYIFNFFKLGYLLFRHSKSTIFLNDPQLTSISLLTIFFSFLFKNKVVFISHGFLFHNDPKSFVKKFYFRYICIPLFKRINLVCVSQNDEKILRRYNFKHYYLILHGFNTNSHAENNFYDFVCIGRNVPHKNILTFLSFIRKVKKIKKDVKAVVITDQLSIDASLKESLGDSLDILTNVSSQELTSTLCKSKYIVSFSSYEGFGMAVMEAVLSGCCPILYGNSSFIEIFNDYPDCIFCVNSSSNALEAYLNLERQFNSINKDLDQIRTRFSVGRMLDEYDRLIMK
mgnify:CR=1 FL=1